MFETHKINDKGFKDIAEFKKLMSDAVKYVDVITDASREVSIFKTKMEEAAFFGTKAIAGTLGNFTEIVKY